MYKMKFSYHGQKFSIDIVSFSSNKEKKTKKKIIKMGETLILIKIIAYIETFSTITNNILDIITKIF